MECSTQGSSRACLQPLYLMVGRLSIQVLRTVPQLFSNPHPRATIHPVGSNFSHFHKGLCLVQLRIHAVAQEQQVSDYHPALKTRMGSSPNPCPPHPTLSLSRASRGPGPHDVHYTLLSTCEPLEFSPA
jgi:hypothetical protein